MPTPVPPAAPAPDPDLAAARDAALRAAARALDLARTAPSRRVVETKGPNDVATEVDRAVERAVVEVLVAGLDVPVQGEEWTPGEDAPTRWVVDPIDGTFNYVSSLGLSAVNLALLVDGEPVVAVTAALAAQDWRDGAAVDDVTVAVRGGGTWTRSPDGADERAATTTAGLRSSGVTVGDLGWGTDGPWPAPVRGAVIAAAGRVAGRLRMVGTSATELAWVATGRTAGALLFGNKPWDVCAGVLQVREAGGVVLDLRGGPWSLASDGLLAAADAATADALVAAVAEGLGAAEGLRR